MQGVGAGNHIKVRIRHGLDRVGHLRGPVRSWPAQIDLELTNRCNLRCRQCWLHGPNGTGDRCTGELDTSAFIRLIDSIPENGPSVYFGGGEPLLRPDLPEIAARAGRRGLETSLTTNATLLTSAVARRLIDAGIRRLHVSLDGPEEVHDRARGAGTYRTAMENLRGLLSARREAGTRFPSVAVKMTVGAHLAGRLEESVERLRAETAGVDSFVVHHLWFITARELEQHESRVWSALGCQAAGAASHLMTGDRMSDMQQLALGLTALRTRRGLDFYPHMGRKEIAEFYAEDRPSGRRCSSPWRRALVKPDGEVRFCPDEWIDGYALGSIVDQDLPRIWNGDRARGFRKAIQAEGCFPGCKRCTWLR